MSRLLLPLAVVICASFALADSPKPNPFRSETATEVPPVPIADGDSEFKQGTFQKAAAWYAENAAALNEKQKSAWAFCRIKLASEAVNQPACESAAASAAEKDVLAALELAPNDAEVQKLGQAVLALTRLRAGEKREPVGVALAGWEAIETASFTVRFQSNRDLAETIAQSAEAKRTETFERWSGSPGSAWSPRCEIVLHATAESYAAKTGKPAGATGHATVRLVDGKAAERRIDIRADSDGAVANVLPRELAHVVLADLFPYTPPPKWAQEGMAVLAGSPEEVDRYARTLMRCARNGELFTLAALLEMKDFPAAEKITGFYCGSVSLVEYLVRLKGEKHFTTFLRDCQRYGSASALKRQYDIASPAALQETWLRAAVAPRRAP